MEISDLIVPGKTIKVFIHEDNPHNLTHHIRAIVDGDQVVYKTWSQEKGRFRYSIAHMNWFEIMNREGWLSEG